MGAIAGAPESGVRYVLTLSEAAPGVLHYRGEALFAEERVVLEVHLARNDEAPGGVSAEATAAGDRRDLAAAAAALVRTSARAALLRGDTPPRKIQRWRPLPSTSST